MRRKRIRLENSLYIGRRRYFLTVCGRDRNHFFGDEILVRGILRFLEPLAQGFGFVIPAYCFMPDHCHLLVTGTRESSDLLRFMKTFKQQTSYEFKRDHSDTLWQPHYYDHVLHENEISEGVAWYIWINPVRKGLCSDPRQWAFSGSLLVAWEGLRGPRPEVDWRPPWRSDM